MGADEAIAFLYQGNESEKNCNAKNDEGMLSIHACTGVDWTSHATLWLPKERSA